MRLPRKQEKILDVLANEREINPRTSLTVIDIKLLGDKVGAYLGIGIMYDVAKLKDLGFISRNGSNVIITQKGLDYVKSRKEWPATTAAVEEISHKLLWLIVIPIIIAVIGGLIVAIITGWRPW